MPLSTEALAPLRSNDLHSVNSSLQTKYGSLTGPIDCRLDGGAGSYRDRTQRTGFIGDALRGGSRDNSWGDCPQGPERQPDPSSGCRQLHRCSTRKMKLCASSVIVRERQSAGTDRPLRSQCRSQPGTKTKCPAWVLRELRRSWH